jgi:tetratricopeptide (TPR) repeat protein/tRNA A-37 threonylcarbamoyl transferase component Bud32
MEGAPREPADDGERTTVQYAAGATHPAQIGPYRILALIGEGAMGIVYEAEQERPHRRVALKIIRPGIATPVMLRRFEHEYEFLGRLQHPGIAQIYEAGVAESIYGPQPYFAMELVRGRRLDEYVRVRQLGVRERLSLAADIADAVQHAHHRGVIHRDLKPGNILVTDAGAPKVLDFGLARAARAELQSTVHTMAGEVVGTMSYMSPEQVAGDIADLDTRSDVYALGVILYELLAGRLPFDIGRKALPEAVRVIREEEPTRLGSVTRGLGADVETIVAKALEKDKLRRYGSAADLAADIRRFLKDEPIVARPPSTAYQVRKFARRHKGLVSATITIFIALVAGVVVSSWQAYRASVAERLAAARASEAQAEKAKAEAVTKFLTEMLASVNPSQAQGRDVTVRAALDAAAAKIDGGEMKGQPEVEVAVRNAIGTTYDALGLLDAGQRQLRTALEIQSKAGGNPLLLAETHARLANAYYHAQKWTEMIVEAREALRLRQQVLGPRHALVASSLDDLGAALISVDNNAEAEPLLREALAIRREVLPPDHPEIAVSLNNVAFTVKAKGNLTEAETMFREALDIDRRRLGNDHPEVATKLVNLGLVLNDQRKFQEAEPFAREAVAIRRKVLGADHPSLANALDLLATSVGGQGRSAEAVAAKREALGIAVRLRGETHQETARLQNNLAWTLLEADAPAEAESLFRKAIPILKGAPGAGSLPLNSATGLAFSLYGLRDYRAAETAGREALALWRQRPNDRSVVSALLVLGATLVAQGRFKEAEPLLREAHEIYVKAGGPGRVLWYRPDVQSGLGAALTGLRRFDEAEPLLIAGYEGLRDAPVAPTAHRRASVERLVTFYAATGRADQAAVWRSRLSGMGAANAAAGSSRPR